MNIGPGKEFDRVRGIIKRIAEITGDGSEIGDDCALIPLGSTNLAISIDNSLENVHFRTDWLDFKESGVAPLAPPCPISRRTRIGRSVHWFARVPANGKRKRTQPRTSWPVLRACCTTSKPKYWAAI